MAPDFNFGLQLLKMTGSLALVLGVIGVIFYGLKRWSRRGKLLETNQWIEPIARYPVGVKQHLLLVRVKSQLLLLGVSPQGVQFLTLLPDHPESSGAAQ